MGEVRARGEGGRFAEVYADATIAWPLVVRAVMERIPATPVRSNARPADEHVRGSCPGRPPTSPHVETEADPTRTDLHLLTRVRFRDADGEEREFFASILELGPRSGRIESARPLETGCQLRLQVVFPRQRQYANRQVQLNYVVRGPHDEPNLLYDLDATEMDRGDARAPLALSCAANERGTGWIGSESTSEPPTPSPRCGGRACPVGDEGRATLPSVVAFLPNGRIQVGPLARRRRAIDATNTLFSSKRIIGRRFDSFEVRNFRDRYPLAIEEQDGWPAFRTRAGLVTPVEVATHVLEALIARTGIDPKAAPVTVTVPAAFAAPQREATALAAADAGLGEVRLLEEPLATAYAYIACGTRCERAFVYDLGGGTFDCAVVDCRAALRS